MPKASVNGIQIHYEVEGAGEPVMLLVGLPGVGKGWGPQIELFAGDFLTIVPDQRGGGHRAGRAADTPSKSTPPTWPR